MGRVASLPSFTIQIGSTTRSPIKSSLGTPPVFMECFTLLGEHHRTILSNVHCNVVLGGKNVAEHHLTAQSSWISIIWWFGWSHECCRWFWVLPRYIYLEAFLLKFLTCFDFCLVFSTCERGYMKPNNLFIGADWQHKLANFGLAHIFGIQMEGSLTRYVVSCIPSNDWWMQFYTSLNIRFT